MAAVMSLWTGTPEAGLWCPKCLLSSGIAVPLVCVTLAGVTPAGGYRYCTDCSLPLTEGAL